MLSSLLFAVYKLSRENTHPENICDIVFEKAEGSLPKGSFKKVLWKISQNSQKKHLCRNLFLIKLKTRRLLLIIAVSIVVKGELANETVNYGTKTKAYVPIWARSAKIIKKGSPGEIWTGSRSSHSQIFRKIGALKNYANSTGKQLCWRHFLIKLQLWKLY